jgi:hypothetical protein
MGLNLAQRFGTGATIDSTTPSDPKLVIKLNSLKNTADGGDITNSQGLDTAITSGNADANADKLFAALLIKSQQAQPTTNTGDTLGAYIDNPTKSFVTRDVQEQIEITYPVNFYVPVAGGVLDPDNVGS